MGSATEEDRCGDSLGRGKAQEGGGRGRGRGHGGGGRGRGGRGDASGKEGTGRGKDKSHIQCFKCHKHGHYANKCPGEEKNKEEAHHARTVEFEPSVLMAETVVPENTSSDKELSNGCQGKVFLNEVKVFPELHYTNDGVSYGDVWYLDNGASNHITGDRAKFRDIDSTISGKVTFGDGSTVDIQGRGSILFQGVSGDQWVLYDVYYIPKLKSNLVSLGQLTEIGHRVLMDDDLIEVTEKNPERVIMRVQRTVNRLYKIELKPIEPVCFLTHVSDQSWLWHGRLGHVNFQSLRLLAEKEMAGGYL